MEPSGLRRTAASARQGEWLLVYSARGRDSVESVEARIDTALRIAEALAATSAR